jgi:tetratricopeptide (TPR) repeat protein
MRKPILILAAALVLMAAGCRQLKSRDQINKGVNAFKNAQFPQAVEHFKTAVELEPTLTTARLYLATAYMQQYVPGADSPDNLKMADAAYNEFKRVLQDDPNNKLATQYIASLMLNEQKMDEAEKWNQKVIQLDPRNADAYYTLGFITWSKWFKAYSTALHDIGIKPDDPGPLGVKDGKKPADKKALAVKAELKQKWGPEIQSGLDNLNKCLSVDPLYADAMIYENLLIRERAALTDSREEYDKEVAVAQSWLDKAMQAKKTVAEQKAKKAAANGITTEEQK